MTDTSLPPLERVHEQIRAALPAMPQAACLDDKHEHARIDYFGDRDRIAELLPQLRDLAARRGWLDGDGSVQLTTDGLRLTLSSAVAR